MEAQTSIATILEFPGAILRDPWEPPHARPCTVDDVEFYSLKTNSISLRRDLPTCHASAVRSLRSKVGGTRSVGDLRGWTHERSASGRGKRIHAADDIVTASLSREIVKHYAEGRAQILSATSAADAGAIGLTD